MSIRRITLILVAVLMVATLGVAQSQFGTISGRVTDATGAVVPGAKVTITNTATNAKNTAESNEEGQFLFANVPAGSYNIEVEKQGFKKIQTKATVAVAQRVEQDYKLDLGAISEVVTVQEAALVLNTQSGELATEITGKELENLPLLTRNPYALVALSAGAVDTGQSSGDTRGLGLSVHGARTSSVNFMLDGGENNDTFVAGVGQTIPLDAVQEMKVQVNNTTAEFGRNPVQVNVVHKTGQNDFHGSAYEYYRGAALSSSTFDDNSKGISKANFVRNQFGASAGGRIIKDKLFYFGSLEGIRVRSTATSQFFVPTTDFANNSSATTNAFLSAFGGIPTSNCGDAAITAQDIVENIEGGGAGSYAGSPLVSAVTAAPIPAATQLFCRTTLKRPADSGGGAPQNTWLASGAVRWTVSDATSLVGRYAFTWSELAPGSVSFSPFAGFNTGQTTKNQNLNLTLTHSFSPRLFSETRAVYVRLNTLQPLGSAPATTPCWQYDLFNQTSTGDLIVFPGYVPDVCSFAGIPFGGPQNSYQAYHGMTYARGKHTWKFGGQYVHMRDNRTFGAYENAYFDTFSMQGMLDGLVDFIFAAIDPKGKVPGDVYDPTIDGAFSFPSFTRHFHYNEMAFYGEDSWKVTPRITLTAGLRWEYYGVPHSPDNEKFLDANLYLNAVGTTPPAIGTKTIFEAVRDARFRRTNQFYRADYNNFAPRIGLAWDIFGTGRTVVRGGYGVYFDRNFGNAVFNAIQNPPNYAVISLGVSAPVDANQFNTLASGGAITISSSARMLNNDMPTAYTQQWSATVEHDLFGKGIIASVSYVGTKGDKLYSLNNLNQIGSCLLEVTANPVCNPDSSTALGGNQTSRLNQTGLTGMNRRGNEGFSRYHGMDVEVRTRKLGNTGLTLKGNYTWSHSIDNEASFFADSSFEGLFGFGFRDAYNPALDRASSTNDIRHRGTFSAVWDVPYHKDQAGFAGQLLGGWSLSGIFIAQTGTAFTVYDGSFNQCNRSLTNFCYPVISGTSVPGMTSTALTSPNDFVLYDFTGSSLFQTQEAFCAANSLNSPLGPQTGLGCTAVIANLRPDLTSPRNLFRTPGLWNVDAAVLKSFGLPWEGHKLQFRAEFFNLFNHSNLYADAGSNQFSGSGADQVLAHKGRRPDGSFERRNIQLALRYTW